MLPPVPPAAAPLGDAPSSAFVAELFTALAFPPLPASVPPRPPVPAPLTRLLKLPAAPAAAAPQETRPRTAAAARSSSAAERRADDGAPADGA